MNPLTPSSGSDDGVAAQTLDEMDQALKRGARVRFKGSQVVHQPFAGLAWVRTSCGLNGELGRNLELADPPITCKRCLK